MTDPIVKADAGWWVLDTLDDGLQMTKNAESLNFDTPFTAVAVIESVPSAYDCHIISKYKSASKGWRLHQSSGNLIAAVSSDGSAETTDSVTLVSDVTGVKALVALVLGGDLNLRVYHISAENGVQKGSGTAAALAYRSTAKVCIGLYEDDTVGLDGNMYWAAVFGSELTENELTELFYQYIHPDWLRPAVYVDFRQTVGSTYDSDLPEPADKNIWFDTEGSPTHGGASRQSAVLSSWWVFDGVDDSLNIPGTDADAALFDPQQHGNDFSVVAFFNPDDLTTTNTEAVFAKYHTAGTGANHRSYSMHQDDNLLKCAISRDGTESGGEFDEHEHTIAAASQTYFAAMTYRYMGNGTSRFRSWLDDDVVQSLDAPGPIRSTTTADVNIGTHQGASTDHEFTGKIYGVGYFSRELSVREINEIRMGRVNIWEVAGLVMFTDFHKSVGATYATEYPPAGLSFDVVGDPTAAGDGYGCCPTLEGTDAYWDLNGTTDALRLDGTEARAADFDPSSNNDNFTVAGIIETDTIGASTIGAILAKWNSNSVDKRCWLIRRSEDDVEFLVSKNGLDTTPGTDYSVVTRAACVSAATPFQFCGRYFYEGDGTSRLCLDVDGTEAENTSAVGPVYSSTDADVQIGDHDDTSDQFWDGKVYWLAFWNRTLSDNEVTLLNNGAHPKWLNPDFYIDFRQPNLSSGDTYHAEMPEKTSLPFDVQGNPTAGGVRYATFGAQNDKVLQLMQPSDVQLISPSWAGATLSRGTSQSVGLSGLDHGPPKIINPGGWQPTLERGNTQKRVLFLPKKKGT